MPSLEIYSRNLSYSYAPGLFPTLEALRKSPGLVKRVLLQSGLSQDGIYQELRSLCSLHRIRTEEADRLLRRISNKDNCYAAAVFEKPQTRLNPKSAHIVLSQPMDSGNIGTILRSALAFQFTDLALIKPCADVFDPHVVRASMGALFSLRILEYDKLDDYLSEFPERQLFPFMLTGASDLEDALQSVQAPFSLLFGNEGSGLPESCAKLGTPIKIQQSDQVDSLNLAIAASIAMYRFSQKQASLT